MQLKDNIQFNEKNVDIEPETIKLPYKNGFIRLLSDGWHLIEYNGQGHLKSKEFICCNSLNILARCIDDEGIWVVVLQWKDYCGRKTNWLMPVENLHHYSFQYIQTLSKRGLKVSTVKKAKEALSFLINNYPINRIASYTNKLGWYQGNFVTPSKVYGPTSDDIYFKSDSNSHFSFTMKGDLTDWINEISSKLREQSRLILSLCSAFAGPLLKPLGIPGGGFHIVGKSSIGKSIALQVSASVWGNPLTYINHWNTTSSAAEGLASMRNDGLLVLDEISQADKKDVGKLCYMLANDKGKSRSFSDGGNRPIVDWRILFLSNGEETLKTLMDSVGQRTNVGMEVRLVHIEADAGKGYGIFDSLYSDLTAENQANELREAASNNYGVAGEKWLNYIVTNLETVRSKTEKIMLQFQDYFPEVKSQAKRTCERFSLLAAAGEIATEVGITGWEPGDAIEGIKTCFKNWLSNYGYDGNQEERDIIKHFSLYFEKYSDMKFQKITLRTNPNSSIDQNETSITSINSDRTGYFRESDEVYLIPVNTFEELCKPYHLNYVVETLDKHGLLKSDKESRKTLKINHPKVDFNRAYAIKKSIMNYNYNV